MADPGVLPVDPFLPEILSAVRRARALVVTAAPGAGKTTRVAPALSADGPTLLLQPRRVAARAIARHIAEQGGWTLGEEVGWQVRFERRFSPRTRLLVATEGILTARAQADPLLSDFVTIVIDEFHERSLHADLALALARQAWLARDDLRLVVMSATLDAGAVSAFLGGCPVIAVPGRVHPVSISYLPGRGIVEGVTSAVRATSGQVLGFLPGAPEIRRGVVDVARALAGDGIEVVPLHGSLPADEQDDALRPVLRRRVILATNIAETSLTVPGVTAVVDSGYQKVARFQTARGIDSLETERICLDSAQQRAGRAGRTAPGLVVRLWDERVRLRPTREPDIARVDLSGLVLDVLAWGGDPAEVEWYEAPPAERVEAAWALLRRLGAVTGRRLTPLGDRLRRLPLHPRLARILVEAGGAPVAAAACALLSERWSFPPAGESTSSDVLSALDRRASLPAGFERTAREIERLADRAIAPRRLSLTDEEFRRALLAGYPDRVARRRSAGSRRFVLASGHGAVLAPESGVGGGEFVVAVDVVSGHAGRVGLRSSGAPEEGEARIRVASLVAREWLVPDGSRVDHRLDPGTGAVRAVRVDLYDRLVLSERPVEPDPEAAAAILADAYLAKGLSGLDRQIVCRLRFAGLAADVPALVRRACEGRRSLSEADVAAALPHGVRADIDRLSPATLVVPSGRHVRLEYGEDGSVRASVKLQELFGLADTPRLGPHRVRVTFSLLAPSGRPVQLTQDLRSFWDRLYPEIRKQLQARYPKHPWPEDPWSATPTARTTRRPRRQ